MSLSLPNGGRRTKIFVNPTGRFGSAGPLPPLPHGAKIMVDTTVACASRRLLFGKRSYEGGPHRSLYGQYAAKNVSPRVGQKCLIQVAYA
jgi:S-adenosylmethionine synthetase